MTTDSSVKADDAAWVKICRPTYVKEVRFISLSGRLLTSGRTAQLKERILCLVTNELGVDQMDCSKIRHPVMSLLNCGRIRLSASAYGLNTHDLLKGTSKHVFMHAITHLAVRDGSWAVAT